MKPRVVELRASSSASSNSPRRMRRKTRTMLDQETRLRIPITNRNVPETIGPISPVAVCSAEPSSSTAPLSPRTPTTTSTPSAKTIVEWPSEKKKPTLSGRWPSAISLRVVLSIAAMWSASKAWRRPSV